MNQSVQLIKKNIKNQSRAQDRFAKIEMDFEDDSLKFKISGASLTSITTNVQSSKLIRQKNIHRLWSMILKNTSRGFKSIYINVFLTTIKAFKVHLMEIKAKLRSSEENIQLKIDKILSIKEIQENEQREKIINERLIKADELKLLKIKIDKIFHETIVTNEFETDLESISFIRCNMDFMFQQMCYIAKKLSKSNMISNVQKLALVTKLDKDKMHTSLSIVLDKKGHIWSLMFGKHVLPGLVKHYEARNGKIKMHQMWDMTTDVDVLFLDFESESIEEIFVSQNESIEIEPAVSFAERTI